MSNGFIPRITHPTRFSTQYGTSSLIDNFFVETTLNSLQVNAAILTRPISDHLGYFLVLHEPISNVKLRPHPPKFVYVNSHPPESIECFRNSLSNTNFLDSLDFDKLDVDSNYKIFHDILQGNKQKHIPHKKVRFNKYKHPNSKWITPAISRRQAKVRNCIQPKAEKNAF